MIEPNTKIVVIDDEFSEVENLLDYLSRNGIPFNYFNGDYKKLPNRPMKGIRLLFLDFVVGSDGQNEKTKISTLLGILKKVIAEDNGPYIVLAWTKHNTSQDKLLKIFREEIMKDYKFPKPIKIIDLDKTTCMKRISLIRQSIEKNFNNQNILKVLMNWEDKSKKATNSVLNTLLDISEPQNFISFDDYSDKLNTEMEKNLAYLTKGTHGSNIKDTEICNTVQRSFTNIFQDHLEDHILSDKRNFLEVSQKIKPHLKTKMSQEKAAILNNSFLIMRKVINSVKPGNIYKLEKVRKIAKCHSKTCSLVSIKSLTPKNIQNIFFNRKHERYLDYEKEIKKQTIPVLIEISPDCDFAHDKWEVSRFILGILLPNKLVSNNDQIKTEKLLIQNYNKRSNLYYFSPLMINDKLYSLIFDAHYTFTFDKRILDKLKPYMRSRKELLRDLQHWFANYSSRPGKAEFHT